MMTCDGDTLFLNPGQDFRQDVAPVDEAGVVDLTGWTPQLREVSGLLSGQVAASIVAGKLRLAITWAVAWPVTGGTDLGQFRLVLVQGAAELAWPLASVRVSAVEAPLDVDRGCDRTPEFTWPDDRDGADLTGDTIEIINASPTLAPLLSAGIQDAATRRVWFHLEGDPDVSLGDAGTFQIQRSTAGSDRRTTNLMRVTFK